MNAPGAGRTLLPTALAVGAGARQPWAAVVLAGGRGARLGGIDKAGIELGGRTLLSWVLDSVVGAHEVVVVGDPVPTDLPVTFVRETPRFGGPAAGLLTGLAVLPADYRWVCVVAVDMPWLQPTTWQRMAAAITERGVTRQPDGAVLVDSTDRAQLALLLDRNALAAVAPDPDSWAGLPMTKVLAPLDLIRLRATGDEARDIDTWADLRDR